MNDDALFESKLRSLALLHRGKVRDNYAIGDDRLLIVASDRLSAFDVVLPDPIPGKGRVLTAISNFWFARTRHIVANHLTGEPIAKYVEDPAERAPLEGRAVVVRRLRPLPVEAVVRGYLIGSGWKDYQASGRGLRHRAAARPEAGVAGCRRRSSRPRPRRPRASTTRTCPSRKSSGRSAGRRPRACASSRSRSTDSPPSTRAGAAS